jgi:PKD repeat protein
MGGYVAPTDQTIAYPCEASKINSSTVTATYHAKATPSIYTYTSTCGEDCQGQDLFRIWAYSIDACVNACVNVNFAVGGNNCTAVALRADMGSPAIQNTLGANCFLKTACQTPVPQPDTMIMHATLNL